MPSLVFPSGLSHALLSVFLDYRNDMIDLFIGERGMKGEADCPLSDLLGNGELPLPVVESPPIMTQ